MFTLSDLIVPPLAAALGATLLGIFAAWGRTRGRARGLLAVDAAFLFPALLPVPVLASAFMVLFGSATDRESAWFAAMVLAAMPLAYLPVRLACAAIDPSYEDTARLLGLGPLGKLLRIELPVILPAVALGVLLVFTRVAGEWMVAVANLERLTVLNAAFGLLAFAAALGISLALPRLASR